MTTYVYIHGLHSSSESFKCKILQKYFENVICLEWANDEDIEKRLELISGHIFLERMNNRFEDVVIVGDSTGGNFSVQLKEKLKNMGIYSSLVLINPLFNLDQLQDPSIMPDNIKKFVKTIETFEDSLILLSNNDEVLDHSKISKYILSNNGIKRIDDIHRCMTFEDHISEIENYSSRLHL